MSRAISVRKPIVGSFVSYLTGASHCRIVGRGLFLALAALAIIVVGFEVPDLRARPEIRGAVQTVDRSLKGDRLPLAPVPRESVSEAKLPFGCEPMVSPLVSRELARIAGRCVS